WRKGSLGERSRSYPRLAAPPGMRMASRLESICEYAVTTADRRHAEAASQPVVDGPRRQSRIPVRARLAVDRFHEVIEAGPETEIFHIRLEIPVRIRKNDRRGTGPEVATGRDPGGQIGGIAIDPEQPVG